MALTKKLKYLKVFILQFMIQQDLDAGKKINLLPGQHLYIGLNHLYISMDILLHPCSHYNYRSRYIVL